MQEGIQANIFVRECMNRDFPNATASSMNGTIEPYRCHTYIVSAWPEMEQSAPDWKEFHSLNEVAQVFTNYDGKAKVEVSCGSPDSHFPKEVDYDGDIQAHTVLSLAEKRKLMNLGVQFTH